jgi:CheY-like chemotaxis protein
MEMADRPLKEQNILVAEDEYYAAEDLRRELTRLGATVIGPAPNAGKALELIEDAEQIDAAILDINLGGEMIFPAADLLTERGAPFIFTTGYDRSAIPSRFDAVMRCEKPIAPDTLSNAVRVLISAGSQ